MFITENCIVCLLFKQHYGKNRTLWLFYLYAVVFFSWAELTEQQFPLEFGSLDFVSVADAMGKTMAFKREIEAGSSAQ